VAVADTCENTQGQFYESFGETAVDVILGYRSHDPEIVGTGLLDNKKDDAMDNDTDDGEYDKSDKSEEEYIDSDISSEDIFFRTICELSVPDDVYCGFHKVNIYRPHMIKKDDDRKVTEIELQDAILARNQAQVYILTDIMYHTCAVNKIKLFAEAVFAGTEFDDVDGYQVYERREIRNLSTQINAMNTVYENLVSDVTSDILDKHTNIKAETGWDSTVRKQCLDLAYVITGLNFASCVRTTCLDYRTDLTERKSIVELPVCLCIPRHDTPILAGNVRVCIHVYPNTYVTTSLWEGGWWNDDVVFRHRVISNKISNMKLLCVCCFQYSRRGGRYTACPCMLFVLVCVCVVVYGLTEHALGCTGGTTKTQSSRSETVDEHRRRECHV